MRFGVVTTSYPRVPGEAAGSFVAELNDYLRGRGHAVDVLAAGDGKVDDHWQPVPVARVPARQGLFYRGGAPEALGGSRAKASAAIFSARMLLAVRRHMRECDGIIAHWLVPCAIASVLAAPGKPVWAIAHGGDVHLLEQLGGAAMVARLLDRPNLHLNFVSKSARQTFADAAGRAGQALLARSSVCSMGVDLARLRGVAAKRTQRSETLHVVFIGRLVRIKGVDLLLEAIAGVPGVKLSVAGAGPEELVLRAQAHALGLKVHWCGELRAPERDDLLARADVVVIPSRDQEGRQEGMPLVALEALAAGAELIAARSGGLAEIPESICWPIPMNDVEALRAALQRVKQGERAAYSDGHWLEERDWSRVAPRLLPGARI